jgi:TonB-linked SusC/RagA family outer membrane protein
MMAQAPVKVKGVVMDTAGASVIAASVVEQGNTSNGVVTDLDGKFELTVPAGAQLVVSSIGYATQVVEVGNQAELTIILEEDSQLLEETVVVGYGTQKKKLVTGSTVQVKGDDLMKLNTTNALGAMQASTPGMQITSASGQPGEGFKVSIRGMGTIGSYQPLYVIDGVAGGDINALNPSDIESIDVLKDAASCAIYGARGANGVVLVTTKQAKAGKYTVTYDGFYGIQNVQRMPEMLDAKQYMDAQSMLTVNAGGAPIDWANILDPKLYASIMDGSFKGTNWLDAIRNQNAPYQNHAVNVVGGSDRTKMSMGISNTSQEGIFGYPVQSKYNRTTVRINSDHVILRKGNLDIISLGQNMTYTYSTKSGIGIGNHYWNDIFNMLVANPILPMYNAAGEYTDYDETEATGLWALDSYVANPIVSMVKSGRGNNQSQNHALNLSANLRIQPIKDLVFRSQVNYRMSASTYRDYSMVYKTSNYAFSDTDTVSQSASAGWNWSWENTLNYKFNIAQKNHFDVLAGSTLEHSGFGESVNAARSGGAWPNDYLHAYVGNMIGNVDPASIGGSTWGDSGLASFFGRINYDYDEKYMLSAIIRADGSSNFARGHRWGIFPSVAAGWVMSSEPWMEGAKGTLDYLKLRASWGQNGNCAVDNFQYLATVAIGPDNGGYAFGHGALENWQTGSYADKLANAEISWETSEQIDLGFDARFFNNRLNLTFDCIRRILRTGS